MSDYPDGYLEDLAAFLDRERAARYSELYETDDTARDIDHAVPNITPRDSDHTCAIDHCVWIDTP